MFKPLVSIIVPTFNRAHLLGKTLDSIIAQTHQNWECLVIDDGSTDGTDSLMDIYLNEYNNIQYHKRPVDRPKGANACRNYGLELATGKLINFFDSDDYMYPSKLQIQVALLNTSTLPFCICQTEWYNAKKDELLGLRSCHVQSKSSLNDYIMFKIFFSIEAPLWRKFFLTNNNLVFDELLHQSQEYDFHIRALATAQNYLKTDEVLVRMIMHGDNMSSDRFDKHVKVISNIRARYKALKDQESLLQAETKIYILKEIHFFFTESVKRRLYKSIAYAYPKLLKGLFNSEFSTSAKLHFMITWSIGVLSSLIFGRGEAALDKFPIPFSTRKKDKV